MIPARNPSPEEIDEFCYAAEHGNIATVRELLEEYGANIVNEISLQWDGWHRTALMLAAVSHASSLEIVELLLAHGANLEHHDIKNDTALSLAVWGTRPDVAAFLITKGADMDVRDTDGRGLLDYCEYILRVGGENRRKDALRTQKIVVDALEERRLGPIRRQQEEEERRNNDHMSKTRNLHPKLTINKRRM